MVTHVIYHADCPDGFGAAWAAWTVLGDTAEYIPAKYGDALPQLPLGAHVVIVDFSYPREQLLQLRSMVKRAEVHDHHKTAQEALAGLPDVVFDMAHSGAYLAWKRFQPDKPVPPIIQYVEDRDLWRWKLQNSREISAAMLSYPFGFRQWEALHNSLMERYGTEQLVNAGTAILRAKTQVVDFLASAAWMRKILDWNVPVVNTQVHISEVCERLLELHPKAHFVACYYDESKNVRKWSARALPGFDVSEVAKKLGGGGHARAAGWAEDLIE